jgi:hypothetical protein
MCSERDEDILALIERLKDNLRLSQKHSLDHTVELLKMAVLELQTILYAISSEELQQFTDAVAERVEGEKPLWLN